MAESEYKIGFIGQGFIGKHMADDFVERGHKVVRYALEEPYVKNENAITECNLVFVAVPTPTTPNGFDGRALETVLPLVQSEAVVVIKSTVVPGTTARLQRMFPTLRLLHSPEFLREKHAAEDTRRPERNIIGMPELNDTYQNAARRVLAVLPEAEHEMLCRAEEAELIKYGGNTFLAMKVVYMNLLYELAESLGVDYEVVATTMSADGRIGPSHMRVIDRSGHSGSVPGRGAGGHCFPKDLAALRETYEQYCVHDTSGHSLLRAIEAKNNQLLRDSEKDLDLLRDIYGM
jgi:UDPglucose 6-dehydrogenase